jgi:DNA-binding MarR family transcriptional regulator
MAVKTQPQIDPQESIEEDVTQLISVLPVTLHNLKRSVPAPMPMRDAMERASLGPRHANALLSVAASEPISVSELAKRLDLLLSSTSTIVGELSRAGLVERAEDERDRRRTIVRVHVDYRDAMEAWVALAIAPIRRTLERLSPDVRAHFMEGWRVLQEEAALHASDSDDLDCKP